MSKLFLFNIAHENDSCAESLTLSSWTHTQKKEQKKKQEVRGPWRSA